ncbi:MAG: histidine kinase dimerization/phosphoacceptor domain -containing protein [candidate division KSB1 bacterium]|nr:histidine kinase dimerization/phosphoacceptor domain -containing protein [candidate division KSB1 bacterium]
MGRYQPWIGLLRRLRLDQNYSTYGLPTHRIIRVTPARENYLVVHQADGVYFGNQNGFEKISVSIGEEYTLCTALPSPTGEILLFAWMHTSNEGKAWLYNLETRELRSMNLPTRIPRKRRRHFWYTSGHRLWLSAKKCLYLWTPKGWERMLCASGTDVIIERIVENVRGDGACIINEPIRMAGVWTWQKYGQLRRDPFFAGAIADNIILDNDGKAICILESGEILYKEKNRWMFLPYQPPELMNARTALFDHNGNVWFATAWGVYLFKMESKRWTTWSFPVFDLRNNINEILLGSDGSLWLATSAGVLVRKPDSTVIFFDEIDGRKIYTVTGLAEDTDGHIWISSGLAFQGAYRWDGRQWRYFGTEDGLEAGHIHKIVRDRRGRLWFLGLTTAGSAPDSWEGPGAFVYERGQFEQWSTLKGLPHNRVYSFVESPDGSLWFGTAKGIGRWKEGRWSYWQQPEGMKTNRVFSLAVDVENRIWFSSQNRWLGYLQPTDQGYEVRYLNDYPGGDIWSITTDAQGRIWVGSDEGVWVRKNGIWQHIAEREGLNYPKVWPILVEKNQVYIGTLGGGLNVLHLTEKAQPRPTLILSPPLQNKGNIIFRWQPLSYMGDMLPDEMESRYRIDRQEWSPWAIRNEAIYTSLKYGKHVFEVQVEGFLGNRSEVYYYEFEVLPPLYLRPLFLVPMSILGFMVLMLSIGYIVNKRRQDELLRQSEEKYREIFENANDMIYTHDVDGTILSVNKAVEKLIKAPREEIIGHNISEFLPADQLEIAQKKITEKLQGLAITTYELEILDRRGRRIPIEVSTKLIWRQGKPVAVQGIGRDISERKIAEKQIQKSLAEKVVLLKEIHHRVKNNLQIISSLLNLQLKGVEDEKVWQMIQECQHRIRTIALIHEMLYQSPDLARVDFASYVRQLVNYLMASYSRLVQNIHIDIDVDSVFLPVDRAIPCGLILNELLSNAIKHAFQGKPSGQIQLQFNRQNGWCELIMQDNGVGLHKRKNQENSGGLGMHLVQTLTEQLHGQLQIKYNNGTRIDLKFPFQELRLD